MVGPNKQTNKQTSIDTHTRAQCSHASVGLAQAHPSQTIALSLTLIKSSNMFFMFVLKLEQLPITTVCEVFNKARFGIIHTALRKGI